MHVQGHYAGVVSGDCLRVAGRIIDKLHHFFAVSWVLFDCSAAIMFSATSTVGSTACA